MISHGSKDGFAKGAVHFGYNPARYHGALTPPIVQTSTYAFESLEEAEAVFRSEREGYAYAAPATPRSRLWRNGSPVRRRLRSASPWPQEWP